MNDPAPPDRLETLISRRLDGEIAAEDDAELARWLETDSGARQLWAQMAAIDRMAAEALARVGSKPAPTVPTARFSVRPRVWPQRLFRLGAAGALAASLVFVATLRWNAGGVAVLGAATPTARPASLSPVEVAPPELMQHLTSTARQQRRTDRQRVGIIRGDRMYLIQFDHSRVAAVAAQGDL